MFSPSGRFGNRDETVPDVTNVIDVQNASVNAIFVVTFSWCSPTQSCHVILLSALGLHLSPALRIQLALFLGDFGLAHLLGWGILLVADLNQSE